MAVSLGRVAMPGGSDGSDSDFAPRLNAGGRRQGGGAGGAAGGAATGAAQPDTAVETTVVHGSPLALPAPAAPEMRSCHSRSAVMCHISRWLDAHEALYGPVTAPPGSLQGVQPWQRSDGAQSTTYHVLIPASVRRVSDLSGCLARTPCGLSFYVNFALLASGCSMLQLLQDGQQAAAAAAVRVFFFSPRGCLSLF